MYILLLIRTMRLSPSGASSSSSSLMLSVHLLYPRLLSNVTFLPRSSASPSASWFHRSWFRTWRTWTSWPVTSKSCSTSRRAWPRASSSWCSWVRKTPSCDEVLRGLLMQCKHLVSSQEQHKVPSVLVLNRQEKKTPKFQE